MKIDIQSVNFNIDPKLVNYTNDRVEKLNQFFGRIINVVVYLKAENTSEKENKFAEIKVHIPGEEILVKKHCRSFEEAVDKCADSIEIMLEKRKEKK